MIFQMAISFFFQAEDGIRDGHVTGVQTCALPILHTCRERGVLCIVDAKRGDIGSTMAGYADAFLCEGGPFAGDALTLSPYLGVGSLAAAVATARENSRGVFLLALTSNPEGAQVQHARTGAGRSVRAEERRVGREGRPGEARAQH